MSNHMLSVDLDTNKVKSGDELSVSVAYESDDGGSILISTGGGFSVNPSSHHVAAAPSGIATFSVKISRNSSSTTRCRLIFHFGSSMPRENFVEVT